MSAPPQQRHPLYVHEAVYYRKPADLTAQLAPLLDHALRRGENVALACREPINRALLEALGDDDRVALLPRSAVYQKAVTAVSYFRDFAEERFASGSRRLCVAGEVPLETNAWDLSEWHRYEALLNHAFNQFSARAICVYGTDVLPEPVLATAELAHPYLRRDGVRIPNPAFVDPAELMRSADSRVGPAPDGDPGVTIPEVRDLKDLHEELSGLLACCGMAQEQREDVILAVHELVTNGLRHGQPPVGVRGWTSDGHFVCAVTDQGPGFDDPFAGYVRGGGDQLPEGRLGLWMARQLCDELIAARTPDGFTVHLRVQY